jgi:flagellar secretion chaperone FliS
MWDTYLKDKILSADPVELVHMLYERAIRLIGEARRSLKSGDILARSQAISTTLEILAELEGSLNHQAGGEISRNLERLYQYMRTRLMTANLKQQDGPLAEVESLLGTLGEAWKAIRPQATGDAHAVPEMAAARWIVPQVGGESSYSEHAWKA